MAGNVHLDVIPGWVWGFLIAAIFFFGVLYLVPESSNLFSRPASIQQMTFKTRVEATAICGEGNVTHNFYAENGVSIERWVCKTNP